MITELKSAITAAPSRRARLKNLSRVEAVKLKVERSALLFRGALPAILITTINAILTAAIAWRNVDHIVLLPWLGVVLTIAAARTGIWLRFRYSKLTGRAMSRFGRFHIVFMALNGALWGALAPIFAIYGLLDYAFLPFIFAVMAAASVVSAGASWRAVLAFNLPLLAPLGATYALALENSGMMMSGVVAVFAVAIAYIASTLQRMIDRSILLHTQNTRMFEALQKQADEAHVAEQRFRALVEASHEVTIIFSPEGRVVYASPSVEAVFGAAPELMVGMTTKEVVHKDDLSQFRSVGEKSLSRLGEASPLEQVSMRASDGDYVSLSGKLTNMLYVPGVEGFVFNGGPIKQEATPRLHAV